MKIIYNETVGYLLHLLSCGLKGEKPMEKPEGVSFEHIFDLAFKHSVANLAYYSVEKLEHQPEESLKRKWKQVRDKAIVKGITQLYERDQIITALTQAGINICPLKGCLLKEMYPQQDMRMMADLDILMERGKAEQVREILNSMGYKTKLEYDLGHDIYYKEPIMNVEMHHVLVDQEAVWEELLTYYKDDWKRLAADSENPHLYHMTWDDFYIYLIVHLSKHYYSGGTGIRSIMDIHIFLTQHEKDLNQAYLKAELEQMKLWEMKEKCEKLAAVWFSSEKPDETLSEMTEYIVQSGTYGSLQKAVSHRVEKGVSEAGNSKFRYLFRRLFPSLEKMKRKYFILKKYPILLPACWFWRFIICVFDERKRKNLKKELEVTRKKQ